MDTGWLSGVNRRDTVKTNIADRLWLTLGAATLAIVVIIVAISGYIFTVGDPTVEPPTGVVYGSSAIALALAASLLWWQFDEAERRSAFPLRRPTRAELALTLVFFPLGLGAFLGGEWVAGLLGFEMEPFYAYDLTDPATFVGVVVGAVIVSPVAEELLYRGALISSLGDRGWSPVAAGFGSIAVFAGYHVFALGVAGVFAIAAWAVFPTILRIRFDNLTGAWLLHLLNNVYAYVIVALFVV
ncbi:CPBP family intramembrane metalloprotease [Halostagnicola sp. A-GB9-2]|uniref:CPBP family intramembrane glutamic endopeptidase n=1 Tax=Halostagnicola sp. A-GB9-2 TaxID=3048066 RepID=UPI0024C0D4FA|nr:CPBP family intramembrane metalloprotease [Halostagnicola sp. A-GB9-2]MDJ1432813.1 CPBP family intramembrane metalloprotease [Halostagnicola sp. A-GB9-2]